MRPLPIDVPAEPEEARRPLDRGPEDLPGLDHSDRRSTRRQLRSAGNLLRGEAAPTEKEGEGCVVKRTDSRRLENRFGCCNGQLACLGIDVPQRFGGEANERFRTKGRRLGHLYSGLWVGRPRNLSEIGGTGRLFDLSVEQQAVDRGGRLVQSREFVQIPLRGPQGLAQGILRTFFLCHQGEVFRRRQSSLFHGRQ